MDEDALFLDTGSILLQPHLTDNVRAAAPLKISCFIGGRCAFWKRSLQDE